MLDYVRAWPDLAVLFFLHCNVLNKWHRVMNACASSKKGEGKKREKLPTMGLFCMCSSAFFLIHALLENFN